MTPYFSHSLRSLCLSKTKRSFFQISSSHSDTERVTGIAVRSLWGNYPKIASFALNQYIISAYSSAIHHIHACNTSAMIMYKEVTHAACICICICICICLCIYTCNTSRLWMVIIVNVRFFLSQVYLSAILTIDGWQMC